MVNTSVFALVAGMLFLVGASASAQSGADVAKTALAEDEKLFAADPASYTSGEKYALQWSPVRENDILWRKRVHRALDAAQEENHPLASPGFSALLLEAVESGRVHAYADERYTRKLTADEVNAMLATSEVSKFKLTEDWLYLRDGRELVGRIIGIAPLRSEITAEGEAVERLLFWIYYPELRPFLRDQAVARVDASVKNLDQWFEGRRFVSADVKTVFEQAPPRMR